jgi:hypothetical protein
MYPTLFFNNQGMRAMLYVGVIWRSGEPKFMVHSSVPLEPGVSQVMAETWRGLQDRLLEMGWKRVPYNPPRRIAE